MENEAQTEVSKNGDKGAQTADSVGSTNPPLCGQASCFEGRLGRAQYQKSQTSSQVELHHLATQER